MTVVMFIAGVIVGVVGTATWVAFRLKRFDDGIQPEDWKF